MRIVGGKWRGRQIVAPPGDLVRPTADRVREAWMSIVSRRIPGARVLDLFAGSGGLGLEALSRGALGAEFVEKAPRIVSVIRTNARALGADPQVVVHCEDALHFCQTLEAGAFDLAFADPPYGKTLATRLAQRWLAVPFATLLGIEHRADEFLPGSDDRRRYGDTVVTFYEQPVNPAADSLDTRTQ